MNKKGFTVVELIAAFALTMVIVGFLFQILINIKDVFVQTSLKTEIEEKLAIISKNIKHNIPKSGSTVTSCSGKNCAVNGINMKINNNSITINGQKFVMPSGVSIDGTSKFSNTCVDTTKCFVNLSLTLKNKNLEKDYKYTATFYYTIN